MSRPMTNEEVASSLFDELQKARAENQRLTDCLFVLKEADPNTTIDAVRSVAYDAVMNLIQPEIAEHQLRVRSGLPAKQ